MTALLWFHGINGDTKMRDIGWSYVVIVVALLFIVLTIVQWRRVERRYRREDSG